MFCECCHLTGLLRAASSIEPAALQPVAPAFTSTGSVLFGLSRLRPAFGHQPDLMQSLVALHGHLLQRQQRKTRQPVPTAVVAADNMLDARLQVFRHRITQRLLRRMILRQRTGNMLHAPGAAEV